ncbi:NAD-dependent epimerase/dehydratase family protein [Marinomonas transparens]|uniref:NAD-dependent epimerase/dehydratase family protein n=1 Tax=Marinomonas transparens TaxID=2795388 RepID=A0A934JLB1_9GAMM|nr:NAD-dependent epimerase/dehydratase family protein [Marinomonas transparens]MBJ7538245.1 NAD-dependent epimerase/dehydratase family protein [Marinomonas transparens]
MATYLVTGGCGFIGSHLCESLIEQGHKVMVLDNLSTGKQENLADGATLFIGDIRDQELVKTLMQEVDGCFHLAAIASVERSNKEWLETHTINQSGMVTILDICAHLPKTIPVVYASSAAVYGDNASIPLTENSQVRPLTAYGVDKLACELQARVGGMIHKVPTMGFRFFNVFGERQDPSSPYSGVISIFADRIMQHQDLVLYGDGSQVRDFVYVKDVVKYLILGMKKAKCNAPVFNICTGKPCSIKNLAETLFSVVGYDVALTYKPKRTGDIQISLGDPNKLLRFFGMKPDYDLGIGLMEMLKTQQQIERVFKPETSGSRRTG